MDECKNELKEDVDIEYDFDINEEDDDLKISEEEKIDIRKKPSLASEVISSWKTCGMFRQTNVCY